MAAKPNQKASRKLVSQGRINAAAAKSEQSITMKVAATLFPVRVTRHDLFNWRSRGVPMGRRRVYLGWYRLAGRVYTTREAVERFILATNGE